MAWAYTLSLAGVVFAPLTPVAWRAVHFDCYARRNLGSPISCTLVFVVRGTAPKVDGLRAYLRECMWWSWRESNPRPNIILVASYSLSGAAYAPEPVRAVHA